MAGNIRSLLRSGWGYDVLYNAPRVKQGDLAAAAGNGGFLSVANPEGRDIVIHALIIRLTTANGGALTVDCGTAANGTTSSDNLLDGLNVNQTGIFTNVSDPGTNGEAGQVLTSTQYVTGTTSGAVTSVAGTYELHYTIKDPSLSA